MASRRTAYNVNTTTKILDSHKQFPGGLKTVDTDDSLKGFFLRDSENISLSEYGFLERRYGLVEDTNFEFLVPNLEDKFIDPNTGFVYYKDRLQGYFEYTRKDKIVETIMFYNGRLYLNGVQVTRLYQYPQEFDPKLGRYNNTISPNQFLSYVERVHGYTGFDPVVGFNNIDDLFSTRREVEGVRIDDRMFFFTGIYPIVYEGTGEFYLLPEFVTNFDQLVLFSHNLHTADLDGTYTSGYPVGPILEDSSELTNPVFGELGYAPMFPYMVGEGRGLDIKVNYKLPNETINNFQGFYVDTAFAEPEGNNFIPNSSLGGIYLELVPEVSYRPSGLSGTEEEELWTRLEQKNVEYTVLNNLSTDPSIRALENLFVSDISKGTVPEFINPARSRVGESLATANEKLFTIRLQEMPSGMYDIRVQYKIYKANFSSTAGSLVPTFQQEITYVSTKLIRHVTFTSAKTTDYLARDGVTPVNDPAALWTCNKVLNHYGKLMAYGSLIYPERVFIGHPTFVHYFPFYFTRDFDTDQQEQLQQITPFMNILVVQSETFTWGLKGIDAVLGAQNFYTPFTISPIYGTIAPKSVRPVRNQLYFLSKDGIVSIQSLYAIDEQYNVKPVDTNIQNIVPQDPEAVAIQYDNQYWIHFPNTPNGLTLRYHVDMRSWMKDTYFEYNGLDDDGKPNKSKTVFNGVFKYLRQDDDLVIITNPMKIGTKVGTTNEATNYKVFRLYVDYSIATDLKEIPRTLFETSYLDQDYPFNEKKYIEQKMQFTIQNEYHLGKEPIFRDNSITMIPNLPPDGLNNPVHLYSMYELPLQKNHDYEVIVPKLGLSPIVDPDDSNNIIYPNERVNIKKITVRLFDIQGNLVKTLAFSEDTAAMPSIFNLRTFTASNEIRFVAYNNDIAPVDMFYRVYSTAPGNVGVQASGNRVVSSESQTEFTVLGVPYGPLRLDLFAKRTNASEEFFSEIRVLHFQLEDGVYDQFTFEPITPSLSPLQVSAITTGTNNVANAIVVTWEDQNPGSTEYRTSYRNLTVNGPILGVQTTTQKTYTLNFTSQQATALQGNEYEFFVEAFYNGIWSPPTTTRVVLELFDQLPQTVGTMFTLELFEQQQLKFGWTDIQYESQYQLYWKFQNEPFVNPEDYPASRIKLLPQNSNLYLFDTTGDFPNNPRIFKNAVVQVKLRGVNSNGTSANLSVREGVYRTDYDPSTFVKEPVNGQSGFKITIPQALKITEYGNPAGHVFETNWEIRYKKATDINYTPATDLPPLSIPTNGNNYFEVLNLEPETDYDVLVRSVFTVNGALNTPPPFQPTLKVTVKTGSPTSPTLLTPSVLNATVVQNPDNSLSFTLRNNDSKKAKIHYNFSPDVNVTVTDANSSTAELIQNQTQVVGPFAVQPGTYYIRAKAYPGAGVSALPSNISAAVSVTAPAFLTATFFSSPGVVFSTQSGYSPLTVSYPGLPANATGWSPTFNPGTTQQITSNQSYNAVYPASPPPPEPDPVPSAPSSVSISSPGDNQVSFSWPSVSGATSYNWQVLFGGSVVDSGTTTTVTSVTRSGIPAGQVQARVQACNSSGCSAYTNSPFVTVSGFTLG